MNFVYRTFNSTVNINPNNKYIEKIEKKQHNLISINGKLEKNNDKKGLENTYIKG